MQKNVRDMTDEELCNWIAIARTHRWLERLKMLDLTCTEEEVQTCYEQEKLFLLGAPRRRLVKMLKRLHPPGSVTRH